MLINILLVSLGGAFGATLRYILFLILKPFSLSGVSFSILLINTLGSLGLGYMLAVSRNSNLNSKFELAINFGIFGAFTTFSTFSKEVFLLLESKNYIMALLYSGISVILGIVFFTIGFKIYSLINNS